MDHTVCMPEAAKNILNTLHKAGYEAYVVGGCVRDSLLSRTPGDWDITTSAKPMQVKKLFRRTIDTGIQHGTVTVMVGKEGYEITTYRVDGAYDDHRRPTEVRYTSELKEDMLRRDFTINAMAYNEEEGLIDHFHGQEDLAAGIIRCVGEPEIRFEEDALRILRAIRFAAQLGFAIEENTQKAMEDQADTLSHVSAERIQVELTKTICSENPQMLKKASELGITSVFLPELDTMFATKQNNPHHQYDVGWHTIHAMLGVLPKPYLRYTMLLHDVAKPVKRTTDENGIDHFYGHEAEGAQMAEAILRRLKMDNATIKKVRNLVKWHDYQWGPDVNDKKVRRAASKIGTENMEDLFQIQIADVSAQSDFCREDKLEKIHQARECYHEICSQNQCLSIKELKINGGVLSDLGYQKGPIFKEILNYLLEQVLENPENNQADRLISLTLMQFPKNELEESK